MLASAFVLEVKISSSYDGYERYKGTHDDEYNLVVYITIIQGFCNPLNTAESRTAVVMYLAMSISHFPNSFLVLQGYDYLWDNQSLSLSILSPSMTFST